MSAGIVPAVISAKRGTQRWVPAFVGMTAALPIASTYVDILTLPE
jgi:hypothetical protein